MMKKSSMFKRSAAAVLSAAMVLSSVGIMPGMVKTASAASDSQILPTPLYYFDFEDAKVGGSSENTTIASKGGTKEGNATIYGSGVIEEAAGQGKVFHNAAGGAKQRSDYLLLPEDTFAHSTETKGITIGFWVNKGNVVETTPFSPIFSAYAQKSDENSYPVMVLQSRLVAQVNCAGWTNLLATQLTEKSLDPTANTESALWITDNTNWHYYTATFDNEIVTVYVDGVIQNQWDATKTHVDNANPTVSGLYSNGSELKYVCLGGNQAWDWGDNDAAYLFDDVAIHNEALSEGQVEALAKKSPVASVTLNKTTATVSNTYYYENNDENGKISSSECGSIQLTATLPQNEYAKSITWSVDDETKASVDKTGLVTLTDKIKNGEIVTVTATAAGCDGNTATATCVITANITKGEELNKVTALKVDDKEITVEYIKKGTEIVPSGDVTITPAYTTANGGEPTIKTVAYTTDEAGSKIIAIDGDKISGLKAGIATVTATSQSADKPKTTFKVTVKETPPVDFTNVTYLVENSGYSRLEGNFDVTYSFHNQSKGTLKNAEGNIAAWLNFVVELTDGTKSNIYRADNYTDKAELGTVTWDKISFEWEKYHTDMINGADVQVHMTRQGNDITVAYSITGTTADKNQYQMTAKCTATQLPNVLYSRLSGNTVAVTGVTLKAVSYKVALAAGNPTTFEHGSIEPLDTTKEYSAGEEVSIITKPEEGYSANITVSYKKGEESVNVPITAKAGENGNVIISFTMPAADVTIAYSEFTTVDHTEINAAITAAKVIIDAGNDDGKYATAS